MATRKKAATKKAAAGKAKATTRTTARSASGKRTGARPAAGKATAGKKTTSRGGAGAAPPRAGKRSAYERFFHNLKADFTEVGGALARDFDKALDHARTELGRTLIDEERLGKVEDEFRGMMGSLKEHLNEARERASKAGERLRSEERAREAADAGLGALQGLATSLRGIAERIDRTVSERRHHVTGDVVAAGRFECRACGSLIEIPDGGRLPPCVRCDGHAFRGA